MKLNYITGVGAALVALMFVGCKPTEKNYRAAYDAANAKREAAVREQMLPASGLMTDDGPQMRVIGEDTVYVLRMPLKATDGLAVDARWSVAVGQYRMDTNAKSGAEALSGAGWTGAFAARGLGDRYYTVADTASSLESAAGKAFRFRKDFPDYPFVGLPGAPVLIGH